ncbi:FtsH protease activity modulator HflK [Chitiniphilus purpureus]|uniref:Protein HflK n=1 Tax=Chitiniphilus purpureus TaxID=2981137 RepID=A0ABY6DIU4_9NEIS|nr:FtsH protease activity modulator HflK [Chitiniphilus sp. CD1]UXY14247.1 FtsH protease activity modulator HflK [Chitiniphilus sp. CD1]
MSQNDPQWGGRRNDGPPDLDEIIRRASQRLSRFFGGNRPSSPGRGPAGSAGLIAIVGVVLVLWGASGLYVVDERENAVILRFGRYVNTVENSGLHWHVPWPIERREIVNMTEIRSLEVGVQGSTSTSDEAMMLTGDQNLIEVQLEVQYTLNSAKDYVFNNRVLDPSGRDMIVKPAAETAIREVVGKSKVDYVLNEGRGQIAEETRALMQELLDRYGAGVSIARVNISDVQPPEQVQASFADAVKARQDRQRLVNEGRAYANDVIPKAEGAAARLLEEAEGYKQRVVAQAEGDTARFKAVAAEYTKAPQVTRDRMYLETMQQIFQSTTKVLVDQKAGSLLYLPLDKLIQQTGAETPASPAQPAPGAAPVSTAPADTSSPERGERFGR